MTAQKVISDINSKYLAVHEQFENEFWSSKMGLEGSDPSKFTSAKKALDTYLSSVDNLRLVEACLSSEEKTLTPDEKVVLNMMKKTFKTYSVTNEEVMKVKDEICAREQVLSHARKNMKLGYVDPATSEFIPASSVQLRTKMRVAEDEATRKACYEGLVSIGDVVAEGLCEVVNLRNKVARMQGFKDFYDMNVTNAEGMNKEELFKILNTLEAPTREMNLKSREKLQQSSSVDDALKPWNTAYSMSGSVAAEMDPYFPFENAIEQWGKSFTALGISYRGSSLTLDLLDRKGKYSNGFCHWPIPAYNDGEKWVPSRANFTSLASPKEIGSGKNALKTLLHEAGHSAHFASVDPVQSSGSPMFAQERAPTSIAYAECQSMFLDRLLLADSDWLRIYAKNQEGESIPWELIEKSIRSSFEYDVFDIRRLLMVPYFEKVLYEAENLTPELVKQLAAQVEQDINGGPAPLPLMAVPHILASESCCYYHGYSLALMSVFQTREYFLEKYGHICDNPNIGKELNESYWKPGNSVSFLELVNKLTGKPLTAEAWIKSVSQSLEDHIAQEKAKYERVKDSCGNVRKIDLDIKLNLVHGDYVIATSEQEGGFEAACEKFKHWVKNEYTY